MKIQFDLGFFQILHTALWCNETPTAAEQISMPALLALRDTAEFYEKSLKYQCLLTSLKLNVPASEAHYSNTELRNKVRLKRL